MAKLAIHLRASCQVPPLATKAPYHGRLFSQGDYSPREGGLSSSLGSCGTIRRGVTAIRPAVTSQLGSDLDQLLDHFLHLVLTTKIDQFVAELVFDRLRRLERVDDRWGELREERVDQFEEANRDLDLLLLLSLGRRI